VQAIGEVFNLFNAKNPNTFVATRRVTTTVNGVSTVVDNASFMRPNEYAGDFQNPEQRIGQVGFRFSF
jgi:hypothetical protein